MNKKLRGFTLVELLIVIVIVAILAAVAVVAYRGVQARAINSAYQTSAKQWIDTIKMYHTQEGEYPGEGDETLPDYTCLTYADLEANDTFDELTCLQASGWGVTKRQSILDDIKESTGAQLDETALPTFTYQNLEGGTEYYRSILYLSRNGGHGVTYPLKGNGSSCVQGATYFEGGDGFVACRIVLDGDPYAGL